MKEDIELIFIQDSLQKKKTARGASARASRKKGIKGEVRFPFQGVDGRTKAGKLYKGHGRVVKYSVEDLVIPYPQFKKLSKEEKAEKLQRYLSRLSTKELAKEWKVNYSTVQSLKHRMGLTLPRIKPEEPEIPQPQVTIEADGKIIKIQLEITIKIGG